MQIEVWMEVFTVSVHVPGTSALYFSDPVLVPKSQLTAGTREPFSVHERAAAFDPFCASGRLESGRALGPFKT